MRLLSLIFLLTLTSLTSFAGRNILEAKDKDSKIEKFRGYTEISRAVLQGSLDSRGMSSAALFSPNLSTWPSVSDDIDTKINSSKCRDISCNNYIEDLAILASSRKTTAKEIEVLKNERSFELRKTIISNAKKSVYVLVWAIYDDETGNEFYDQLIDLQASRPEVDIRLIVDGNIAELKGHSKVLKFLGEDSKGKIKTIKWKSRKYRANGNHRKLIVVDDEHVILGGMNIGNNYSHKATDDKWRDLDIYFKGKSVGSAARNQFADVWNLQLKEIRKLKKMGEVALVPVVNEEGGTPIVLADQHPGSATQPAYHHVHTSLVKLFRDARESIDIENAYFIMDPIFKKEIKDALDRGVKVRVHTNSDTSIDEPMVVMPIMYSAKEAAGFGAEVYLKKGKTLHSKYMVVDRKIVAIGSFNFHPRSLRFDAENIAIVIDEKLSAELTDDFENGLLDATLIKDAGQFTVDFDFMGLLMKSFYFDFL